MPALQYWLWLSSSGASPRGKWALIEKYGGAESAFFAPEGDFSNVPGLSARDAALLERRSIDSALKIAEACEEQGIDILCCGDAAYPKRLRSIYAPPVVLYVKGRLPEIDETPLVAVIGTRRASPYGLKMARELSGQIAACGGAVVSGLTAGIDAEAARGALLAGGRCLGVLGTAHEQEKSSLSLDVAATGALISEYPPGTRPMRSHFRERNRIASGISMGVVVVEAPEKSGALLFAREAAEQGREIFAVPGNADAEGSVGTNSLLKEGAKLVTCGWDVMGEFQALYPDRLRPVAKTTAQAEKTLPVPAETADSAKKAIDKEKSKGYIDLKEQLSALSAEQLSIINAIGPGARHIDDIIKETGLATAKVLAQLTILELKGYINRQAGRRFSLNTAKK